MTDHRAASPAAPAGPSSTRTDFDWHPEPELIGIRDEAVSRPALAELGREAWSTAIDYIYDEAFRRAIGEPVGYADLRATFFGTDADGQARGPRPAPVSPTTADAVLLEFRERVAPHLLNAYHPAALSYFTPPPLVMSVVGELLAQVTQQGIDVWECGPAGAFVEEEVVRWLTDLIGYPPPDPEGAEDDPFGILTSGGVMANFLAMTLARDVHLPRLTGAGSPPRGRALEGIRVYAGDQVHFSIARALDELGFPTETLHLVPSDGDFRLRTGPVAEAIGVDRKAGLRPLAIAAVAGSTNTGSIDEIPALADLAAAESLWLHVDAAYGGAARLSPRLAGLVPGLERADSVTVDPHKWFFQAYDIGALLVRRRRDLLATFHRSPEYYPEHEDDDRPAADAKRPGGHVPAPTPLHFYQHGMEGTRRWRALKLWLSWKHLGSEGLAHLIEATADTAAHLARRIAESDDFEALPADPPLSVVCFRHLPDGRAATSRAGDLALGELDAHQVRLQRALEASGEGWLSTTTLRGRTYLRAGIVNYLTTPADIDELLAALRRLAAPGR